MNIKCLHCGQTMIVPACRLHLKFCSVGCLKASRLLDEKVVQRVSRLTDNRREASKILGIPYSTLLLKLRKQGLNHLFADRGNYAR
jgi:hypothetical protein